MKKYNYILIAFLLIFYSCKSDSKVENNPKFQKDTIDEVIKSINDKSDIDFDTLKWAEIKDDNINLDLRYATNNNFVHRVLYRCPRCFLRPKVAKSIAIINYKLMKDSLHLKLFDCYRPKPIQQKLWDIVPDARYVTPPKRGSMHNRGLAIDLTLVNFDGKELDMGTKFDYFGFKAYHTNKNLPKYILKNREILKNIMTENGFRAIRTEWWHYSFTKSDAPISDWEWNCE